MGDKSLRELVVAYDADPQPRSLASMRAKAEELASLSKATIAYWGHYEERQVMRIEEHYDVPRNVQGYDRWEYMTPDRMVKEEVVRTERFWVPGPPEEVVITRDDPCAQDAEEELAQAYKVAWTRESIECTAADRCGLLRGLYMRTEMTLDEMVEFAEFKHTAVDLDRFKTTLRTALAGELSPSMRRRVVDALGPSDLERLRFLSPMMTDVDWQVVYQNASQERNILTNECRSLAARVLGIDPFEAWTSIYCKRPDPPSLAIARRLAQGDDAKSIHHHLVCLHASGSVTKDVRYALGELLGSPRATSLENQLETNPSVLTFKEYREIYRLGIHKKSYITHDRALQVAVRSASPIGIMVEVYKRLAYALGR